LERECANRSLATNGSFNSLTIDLDDVGEFPSAVFEGIAGNPSITRLTIILASQSFCGNTAVLPVIGAGFRSVKTLSFELFWKPFPVGRASNEEKSPQQMFDVLCDHMCAKACIGHRYSQISFIDGYSQNNARIKSNPAWDSRMSPALLLNWQREQETLTHENSSVIKVAVQAINKGVPYCSATNLMPVDLSASSATGIFVLLKSRLRKSNSSS
jgi:hypothetical protein